MKTEIESEKKIKDLDKCYVSQQQYNQTTKSIEESKSNISNLKSEIKRIIKSYPKPPNFEPNIHIAAYNNNLGSVAYLIMNGTNIYEPYTEEMLFNWYFYGRTPIIAAAAEGHLDIIEYLVQNGANINSKALHGWNSIHYAAPGGQLKVVEYLIKNGVEVDCINEYYYYLLLVILHFIFHHGMVNSQLFNFY